MPQLRPYCHRSFGPYRLPHLRPSPELLRAQLRKLLILLYSIHTNKKRAPKPGLSSDCRKTYITKRVVRPTPINPQKTATCAWLFALLKGGAPRWSGGRTAILSLVRCPDGHTFFAFLRTTGPARERSMGAEALRQPLAKTRKSGLSHFFVYSSILRRLNSCINSWAMLMRDTGGGNSSGDTHLASAISFLSGCN